VTHNIGNFLALIFQVERATEVEINTGPAKPPGKEAEEVKERK
jgi:hypothetical protein